MSIPMIDASMAPLDAAAEYAARGWRVLPIKPNEKRPPMAEWQKAATTEADVIDAWWSGLYRGHGIGVATGRGSGIFVLDVDVAGEKAGDQTLAELEELYGKLPYTPTAVTPSGGVHYYFALPEGVEIRNDAGSRLGHGLDIRGEGGQVVAPPTRRGGDVYAWLEGTYELEPAQAPDWLIERVVSDPITRIAEVDRNGPVQSAVSGDNGPAQRYNQRTTWSEMLEADGWTLTTQAADGEQGWTRPGKSQREGISATVGHGGGDQLTVFTSSIPWLPMGSYSRFGYYACRFHQGDRSAAARALRAEDYAEVEALLSGLPTVAPEEAVIVDEDGEELETGWDPVDLTEILSGDYQPPRPEICWREDGECLFYRGRMNALYGESGSGKSWVAMAACSQIILRGGHVIYIDLEDHPSSVLKRMQDLGCSRQALLERFHYISPMLAWHAQAAVRLVALIRQHDVELSVIDSTGEAMALDGAEPNSDDDTARWFRRVPRTLARAGSAVLLLDHVPKAKDAPLGFAIGSQRKRAAIDGASYRVDSLTPPAKGEEGRLRLVTAKDRGGYHQQGKPVAEVIIRDGEFIGVELLIIKPTQPLTVSLPDRIGAALSQAPDGMSMRSLRDVVGGRAEALKPALEDLESSGVLEHRGASAQSRWHLVKPIGKHVPPVDNSSDQPETATASPASARVPDAVAHSSTSTASPRPDPKEGTRGSGDAAGLDEGLESSSSDSSGRGSGRDDSPVDNSDWLDHI